MKEKKLYTYEIITYHDHLYAEKTGEFTSEHGDISNPRDKRIPMAIAMNQTVRKIDSSCRQPVLKST